MGKLVFNYRSETLGHYVDVHIVLPTDNLRCSPSQHLSRRAVPAIIPEDVFFYQESMKFQTVYLMHGGGDDASLTYRYTNAERYAQRNNVMLVTPNIPNSFGANARYGVPYMTFITQELPTVIQGLFPSSSRREDNFIMGYAMGGNVALAAALIKPERYSACMDISGGIGYTLAPEILQEELKSSHFRDHFTLYGATFGDPDELIGSELDLYRAAQQNQEQSKPRPEFIVACGSKEFIRSRVEKDAEVLKELGYNTQYFCAEGYDHDFEMWDEYIKLGLDTLLPLRREPICPLAKSVG